MTDLSSKVAVVTGAARGIGKAIALELARCGADLVICDLLPQISETAQEIEAFNVHVIARTMDAGHRQSTERLFSEAAQRYGAVDILVNNVGLNIRKPLWDLEVSDVEAVWSSTLWSVFHCSQLAARQMRDRNRGGSIVCISSVHGSRPYAGSSAYNAGKAAVNHMVGTWASELAPYGIRVNAIEPGWIDTPGERVFASEEDIQTEAKRLPFGRLGSPQEIANAVAFLVSDYATYITGACLRVDGGYLLTH